MQPGSDILREEIFGPVLAIVPFDTEDDAVRIANDTEYGLVSYVFTENLARGQRMIERLETGMMGLNVGVVSNAAAPFGGWKMSGLGREGGAEGIHEYLQTKYTLTAEPVRLIAGRASADRSMMRRWPRRRGIAASTDPRHRVARADGCARTG